MSGRKIPYPWGRLSPEKRVLEIGQMIERHRKQKEILRVQFEQSMKKLDMNIEALSAQIAVAKSFEEEDRWAELRERVFRLELSGVEAMGRISGATLEEAERIIVALEREENVVPEGATSIESDEDFLSSSLGSIDELFQGEI